MQDVVQGEIRVLGPIHGGAAINTIVTFYSAPNDWEMKQFVTQIQLDEYARDNSLAIHTKEE